ncbi:MAG: O-methyltransferase [Bacteroidetes bacterium]|nr:O-methyltransferase [Bacteroidota bacterium]
MNNSISTFSHFSLIISNPLNPGSFSVFFNACNPLELSQSPNCAYLCENRPIVDIVHPLALDYAEKFSSAEDSVLNDITVFAHKHPHAQMLSGHVQGKFLEMLSFLVQPKYVLEIGTFMGYSALCLAKGLQPGGQLHTIELREEDAKTANTNFDKANASHKIILHAGNALDIIPTLQMPWDLVFIDADKTNYAAYYKLVLPQMRSGGLIVADNVLFHGDVLQKEIKGKNGLAIHAFNKMVKEDETVEKVLLTVRDGLLLIRKK